MNSDITFQAGVKDVIPTLLGYIGVGVAYGVVAQTSNFSLLTVAVTLFDCVCWIRSVRHYHHDCQRQSHSSHHHVSFSNQFAHDFDEYVHGPIF